MEKAINIFWFRRDLRLSDNTALYHALREGLPVLPIFIFDPLILNKLENKSDRRVKFIHESLQEIQDSLLQMGASLCVLHKTPADAFEYLLSKYKIQKVFNNHDYEPYAIQRDNSIAALLKKQHIDFISYKDQVIFEKTEVVKEDGKPYTVFTPYSRKWKSLLNETNLDIYSSEKLAGNFVKGKPMPIPSLAEMGFLETSNTFPSKTLQEDILNHYGERRNYPGMNGTSRMGVHLRFGTISIRQLAARALAISPVYLNELIWRDFYHMILYNFPQVGLGKAFKPAYDTIEWRIDNGEFKKWCDGQTGYPLVDAGMRELNETGFMHNRVRMVVASFLCKHLLLDWRLGEAYFAEKLLDFDLAANNGGWQWAAGSGCDAAPYFRIFNPYLQTKRFDPDFIYIKKWVPEFQEFSYPKPIVDHEFARKRCLETYAKALNMQKNQSTKMSP
jgi:deoxyribodipyrimidine photo-lyase